jgi:hypothetical protein
VLADVIALTIEFVSLSRVTPKIQVVSLFRVTATAAVLRQWFRDGLRSVLFAMIVLVND